MGGSRITSTALLERFRRAISATYPFTSVGRDGQAVAVRFSGTGVSLDVVPAVSDGKIRNANAYLIPDGSNGWMQVVPLVELTRFKRADTESKRKLGKTLQLLKLWKHARSEPVRLRSYYIELALTASGIAVGHKSYSEILTMAFRLMCLRGSKGLRDPDGRVGLTNPIPPRATTEKVMEAMRRGLDRAVAARSFEIEGNPVRAAAPWRMLFNGNFPHP